MRDISTYFLDRASSVVSSYTTCRPMNFDVFNGGGSVPKPPKPPAPPTTNDAAAGARKELDRRKPQGFASTILTGGLGDSSTSNSVRKTLLGA